MRRARPVLVLAAVAFAAGAIIGARHSAPPGYALADQFVTAWTRREYTSMYSDVAGSSRRSTSVSEFASDYREALTTATATRVKVLGRARAALGGGVTVPVRVDTRLFGALSLAFTLPIDEGPGGPSIVWSRSLAFPGLRPGERLSRSTSLPQRAPLLARDGSLLAEAAPGAVAGAPAETTRNSPLGAVADTVLGTVGPVPPARRQALEEQGVPAQAIVGLSGLELALDSRLRGAPGGELLAGARPLAYAKPHPAPPVRTTVSPVLQRAAVTALGGQLGGIIAMQPSTGQILAVAGLGLDGLQPPGSTFKMITTTGVLAAKIATEHTVFPYATFATLDGVKLNNANGEECGGSLELAFAVSCNSVFSPLGVKLGAERLVATAERFGFNHEPGIAGAAESTLPPASEIQGELDVGSTAIGQGEVLASPLEMATVAATIADGGRRPRPTFLPGQPQQAVRVMSASVARNVRHLMIAVVREGTGTSAAIPGVTVAGKTGTAELKTACTTTSASEASSSEAREAGKEGCQSGGAESEAANTDAWFAAFAPALHPRIVVCVLLVKDGAGGATAAPVAREVLEAGLQAEH
ncbi:MAG: penicillin-binding transpeptidase domain-containing protein [Solirubrobacteraceae bacterium]